jgi:uncharacterized protein
MKVVLIGASGMIGSRVLQELASRGHQVVAVARNPEKIAPLPGVTPVEADLHQTGQLENLLRGVDAVVSAISPPQGQEEQVLSSTRSVLDAARHAGARRVLIVGGAASLFVAPGITLLASGHLPQQWLPIGTAHANLLHALQTTGLAADLDWTYFSPAAFIQPGERTGKFRLGKDALVADGQGQSRISAEDYAVALVDELEKPQHLRQRFTIGY